MKKKIYLEPQNKFNKCISKEDENQTTYNFYQLLDALMEQFDDETNPSEDELNQTAIDWFHYNIEPLSDYYNINFNYEIEAYYLISYNDENGDKRFHKSAAYPGRIIYHSQESAQNALQRIEQCYPHNTVFKIERMKND